MDMRISNVLRTQQLYPISNSSKTAAPARLSRAEEKKDMIALSSQARDYQSVKKALNNVPDIRTDKVDAIKAKMDAGQYDVKTSDIVDQMLAQWIR